jgi:class 3 adenylate cyclase
VIPTLSCALCGGGLVEGARYCHACGREAVGAIERELRHVSAMFVDMVGFSALTHALDPEPLRDLADLVLTEVAAVVEAHDGHVDAFRGDGVIALFGATVTHADDPSRAVRAAAEALEAIRRVGRARGVDTTGRAGVATGRAVVGFVGSGSIRPHTAMGSTVNLASRLENAAGAGEVWVDDATYRATHHGIAFERIERVDLPGFPNVTTVHRLRQTSFGRGWPPLPLIGRDAALAQLIDGWEGAKRAERSERLTLIGPSGSGKTRLLEAFANLTTGGRVVRLRHGPLTPFAWSDLAADLFGPGERGRAAEAERLQAIFEQLLPGQVRWHHALAISLGFGEAPAWNRLERRRIDRALLAWRDLLLAIAERDASPLRILIDDEPHDPRLTTLADLLAEARIPLLVIATHRGRDAAPSGAAVALPALPPADAGQLFAAAGGDGWPDDLPAQPGDVLEAAAVAAAGEPLDLVLERTWQGRFGALPGAARRLLAALSICPAGAPSGMLRALLGADADPLRDLRCSGVLDANGAEADGGWIRFGSERFRTAVTTTVTQAQRRRLHQRMAGWWEAQGEGGRVEAAWHHAQADGAITPGR